MDEQRAKLFRKNLEQVDKNRKAKGIVLETDNMSSSDKKLSAKIGREHFRKLSDSKRDIYKKAYGIVSRHGPKLALAALSGPVGLLAAGISEASAATPANAGEDQLIYKRRRKKVPGGGPDEASVKRERSNKYARGGVAKGFKGHF